ncbi:MAG: circularly permuted type 2 ATP-grasp protein [Hyphomicrobiales bacterium]|nr:circularly permuted type 2 ATP-grasp protein [Hyphomicrobiales bacterium]MCP5370975.1 circularly permuted type 2 ATP-grasp protein [Hyphomicrobiales bacterium]
MAKAKHSTADRVRDLLAAYRPPAAVADELLEADGRIRPVWTQFINYFARLPRDNVPRLFARGDQHLRDAGVYFRQYGPEMEGERDWPLSHVPVLISEKEWQDISDGLIQRAELLERILADIYGSNKLVSGGYLPAQLVAGNPEWLRPLVGVKPRSGHFLHLVAFDIGRGPDGTWWVLGDRTQAPSGIGFALENRVATRKVFSDLFANSNVIRLADFFRVFRDAMTHEWGAPGKIPGILSPGPLNDTYFEHAFIARYLGLMLLEGEDLRVEDGQLLVRTVTGLHPVGVLWRRLDAAWVDPLELNEGSQIGTPGLVSAVRQGSVTMVNALGSGIMQTRALLAFLPRISERLLGEPLALPNIATWWCGQEAERGYVRANVENMVIGEALSTNLPFDETDTLAIGGRPQHSADLDLPGLIDRQGDRLVGQEAVTLSTTPAYVDGMLVPRPMSLRVFLARTAAGWQVMPGGFARIGRTGDPSAVSMQAGGAAADVWILSEKMVEWDGSLHEPSGPFVRAEPGMLPSRAADNLFWLGRYVERTEMAIRLLRAYHARRAEAAGHPFPVLEALGAYLAFYGIDPEETMPRGLLATLSSAINNGRSVRDRFSVDGWMALIDLARGARELEGTIEPGDDVARAMGVLLRKVTGFSGLVHENMYRFAGWRFLSIGRALERASATASLLQRFLQPDAPEGSLDLMVEACDSVMSHRRLYAVDTNRETVIDLLALDTKNPRAILFQLNEVQQDSQLLPGAEKAGQMSALSKAILKAHTALAVASPETLDHRSFGILRNLIDNLSDDVHKAYLR